MKRLYTFIVLLGLVMGAMLTGCNKEETTPTTPGTNPPTAPAMPSTNK